MRTDRLLLLDVLEAIDEAASSLPAERASFDADKFVRSHILRQVQIVGEATWRLSDGMKVQFPSVPWRQMAGMRHILVHDYFQVSWERVYLTARDHLPALRPMIEQMLGTLPPET